VYDEENAHFDVLTYIAGDERYYQMEPQDCPDEFQHHLTSFVPSSTSSMDIEESKLAETIANEMLRFYLIEQGKNKINIDLYLQRLPDVIATLVRNPAQAAEDMDVDDPHNSEDPEDPEDPEERKPKRKKRRQKLGNLQS
jgi:hypothetical protein